MRKDLSSAVLMESQMDFEVFSSLDGVLVLNYHANNWKYIHNWCIGGNVIHF